VNARQRPDYDKRYMDGILMWHPADTEAAGWWEGKKGSTLTRRRSTDVEAWGPGLATREELVGGAPNGAEEGALLELV
jgi:hypothetical protein